MRSNEPSMAEESERADRESSRARFVRVVFERFRQPLLVHLKGLLRRREDAEDVLQESYARLLTIAELDPSLGRTRALLYKIATNLAFDRFRQRRARGEHLNDAVLADQGNGEAPAEQIVEIAQSVAIMKRVLKELSPRTRQVLLLRCYSELSYDDIAARLGVSKRTVEREMQHALDVCQRRLRAEDA